MSQALLDTLAGEPGVTLVDAAALEAMIADPKALVTAVFITGDPDKKLETADVAVVAREFLRMHPNEVHVAMVARADEAAVMKTLGLGATPALALMRDGERVAVLPKIQDWSVYADAFAKALGHTAPA